MDKNVPKYRWLPNLQDSEATLDNDILVPEENTGNKIMSKFEEDANICKLVMKKASYVS